MSANPFTDERTNLNLSPSARASEAEQLAAIDAMRARQAAAAGPTVFLPFGKQAPLSRYAGMKVVPFVKNQFVDRPEMILENPDPAAHYGWARKDDPEVKGKLRSGRYEAVYIDELRADNEASIMVEDVLTERGPNKLVLWHGLMLIRIPPKTWFEQYEQPALSSAVRLTQHQQSFHDFSMKTVTRDTTTDEKGLTTMTQGTGADFRELRGKVETSMDIQVG